MTHYAYFTFEIDHNFNFFVKITEAQFKVIAGEDDMDQYDYEDMLEEIFNDQPEASVNPVFHDMDRIVVVAEFSEPG
tara:strand:+ start:428 stop:658 length:231 start_codon:yes stop_codon:yes gene_type:complete